MRLIALLAVLGIAAVGGAETITAAGELAPSPSMESATRAMAAIEFYEGDSLEATIDVVHVLLGEQGNGLTIGFAEEALGRVNPSTYVLGNSMAGYVVGINTDWFNEVTYDDIMYAVGSIFEVNASLRSPVTGNAYGSFLQNPPPPAVLAGGAEAVIPEPSALVLTAVLCVFLGTEQRRLD